LLENKQETTESLAVYGDSLAHAAGCLRHVVAAPGRGAGGLLEARCGGQKAAALVGGASYLGVQPPL